MVSYEHPKFIEQFILMANDENNFEILGEINALLRALEEYGHEIEGEQPGDVSCDIKVPNVCTSPNTTN